ncbi:hypothetical protein LTR28_002448 [Elasticomyces elasticus]|nr:hypothetical protein LTR28_002448 [Elasticomyces elasticus]
MTQDENKKESLELTISKPLLAFASQSKLNETRRQQIDEDPGRQPQGCKQGNQRRCRDVDGVAISDGEVQQLSTGQHGNAGTRALVQELLAVVDGSRRAGGRRGPADIDVVAVENGDAKQRSAVTNRDAKRK